MSNGIRTGLAALGAGFQSAGESIGKRKLAEKEREQKLADLTEQRKYDEMIKAQDAQAKLDATVAENAEKVKLATPVIVSMRENLSKMPGITDMQLAQFDNRAKAGIGGLKTGGSLDGLFDDLSSTRKNITDPSGTLQRNIIKLTNPELDAKLTALELKEKGAGAIETKEAEVTGKFSDEVRGSLQNYEKIGGAIEDYSKYQAGAIEEGGAGSTWKKWVAEAKLNFGGPMAEELVETGKLHGQRGETAMMMMPAITGSVRIIKSVFKYILESLPDKQHGPKQSRGKLRQTSRNMYRMTRAMTQMGLTPKDLAAMDDATAEIRGEQLVAMAQAYRFEEGEEEEVDKMTAHQTRHLETKKTKGKSYSTLWGD